MRIPNPSKLLPEPRRLVDLTKRVAALMPGMPGHGRDEMAAAPPPPARPPEDRPKPDRPKPKAAVKPKKAAAKPKADAKPKPKKPKAAAKPKPKPGAAGKPKARDPHHVLNNSVDDPDPTEWPDPYDKR